MELKINIDVDENDNVIISGNETFADIIKTFCVADEQAKKYKKWREEHGVDEDDDISIDEIMEELDKLDKPKEIISLTKEEVDELLNSLPILNKDN